MLSPDHARDDGRVRHRESQWGRGDPGCRGSRFWGREAIKNVRGYVQQPVAPDGGRGAEHSTHGVVRRARQRAIPGGCNSGQDRATGWGRSGTAGARADARGRGLGRMIVLDTNVVSECMRPAPHGRVIGRLALQPRSGLFTATVACNSGTVYMSLGAFGRRSADRCPRSMWPGGFPRHAQSKSPDESGFYSVKWGVPAKRCPEAASSHPSPSCQPGG